MPSKAAKDKLTERLEDQPPFNDPHHRTTRPRRSALKLGSDSGLDPLPIRSQGASPTRSGRSRPTRAYSPRPGTRRSSTSHAVQRSDFERASRAPRRTLSQDIPTRPRRTSGMSPGGHREKRSLSRERRTSKSHRRINNINQIEVQQGFNQTQVRNNHGLKAGAAPRATGPHSISSRNPTSWPEMVHISPSELPSGSSLPAVDVEHIQQRHRYLQHYKNVLKINALHALLSEQVAPLNPVLAVPPPSYRLFGFGTWLERKLENSNWMLNRRAQANALPGLEWDVRTGPEEATISAWPYTTLSCTSNGQFPSKKEMKTRGALDDAELRRFYGQTVTNPPSSFVVIRISGTWSIRVRSGVPGGWVCVYDVISAIHKSLTEPVVPIGTVSSTRSMKNRSSSSIGAEVFNTTKELPTTRLSTLKSERYIWVGLRRELDELRVGAAVKALPNGEIDGGTWWLVLRKP